MGEGAETPASMASRRGIGSTPSAIPPTAPHWRLSGRLATAARPRRRPGIGHAELPASRGGPFLALVCGRFGAVQARVFRPGARRPLGGASPARVRLPLAARRRHLASHWLDAPVEELDPLRGIVAGVLRIVDERAPSGAGTRCRRGAAGHGRFPSWLEREEHRPDAGARDARRSGGARPRSRYRFERSRRERSIIESRT
jgi:hypothetical protein